MLSALNTITKKDIIYHQLKLKQPVSSPHIISVYIIREATINKKQKKKKKNLHPIFFFRVSAHLANICSI